MRQYTSLRVLLLVCLCPLLTSACARQGLVDIRVGGVGARVELAVTDEHRRRGLMQRQSLAADEGLLMVFPETQVVQLWMLNVPIPLDVGFFDDSGALLHTLSMQPDGGRRIYRSSAPARYALEMNSGWFDRHGIGPGARLEIAR